MLRPYIRCLLFVFFSVPLSAEDWPQWQGTDRNAMSKETGLLKQWPESGPPLAWKVDGLGGGDSAPAIADGKLFGMSNRDGKEIVWALSEKSGKEIWVTPLGNAIDQRVPQSKEGPGSTPSVDGDRLYVIGMSGRVACLSVNDGKVIWRRSMTQDFGGTLPTWSYRESPLVDGKKVICTPGSPDALIVALDKQNGKTIWKSAVSSGSGGSTDNNSTRDASRENERTQRQDTPSRPNTNDRPSGTPQIKDTKEPGLFLSEHWGMTAFSHKLPNGKYLAKLYFAETYSGIRGVGQRVFTLNVQGKEFKDFDIWRKAGGFQKAYIESVPVEVKEGEFRITFTRQVESPAIKAIEIIPQDDDAKVETVRIKAGQSTPFKDSKGQVWLADQGFTGGSTSPGFVNRGGGASGGRGGFGGGRSGAAYSSAIAFDFEGQRQYVQLTANSLIGVAASDGKILWQYDAPANRMGINCSTPIYHDGLIFAASAYGNGGGAVKLKRGKDGKIDAEEIYFTSRMQNHHGGMIVVDGAIYGANGGNGVEL